MKREEAIECLEKNHNISWSEVKKIILANDVKGVLISKIADELDMNKIHIQKAIHGDWNTKALPLLFSTAVEIKKRNTEKASTIVDYIETVR